MKKFLSAFLVAMILVPNAAFAATPADLEAQHVALLRQIIVLLQARLQELLSSQGQVLGVSTTNLETTVKRSGGGGGGGSRKHKETPAALVLDLQPVGQSGFIVSANQTLSPDSISIALLNRAPGMSPLSITVRATTDQGTTTDIVLTRAVSSDLYSADMHGRLATGSFTGSFDILFPSPLNLEPFTYQVTYVGNGLTRAINITKQSTELSDLSVHISTDDPDPSFLLSRTSAVSDPYTIFAFDIENDDAGDAQVSDIEVSIIDSSDLNETDDLIDTATLSIDGTDYAGVIGTDTILFNDLNASVTGNSSLSASLKVSLKPAVDATTITAYVEGGSISATHSTSGDVSIVTGNATGATHTIGSKSLTVEAVSTSQSVTTPGTQTSATFGTFTIKFDVTGIISDVFIPQSASTTSGSAGVTYGIGGNSTFAGASTAVLTSTADLIGGYYRVDEGNTETFTLTVSLDPSVSGTFFVKLMDVAFNDSPALSGIATYAVDQNDEDFRTDSVYIPN